MDENKEIIWSPLEKGIWYSEQKKEFVTSLGIFVSNNWGEFGGTLITPKENIFGNFINVFECDGIAYAIDSCNHMGVGHLKVYSFSEDSTSVEIYSTNDDFENNFEEWVSFEALYVDDNKFYILASGIVCDGIDYEKSYFLEFSKGKLVEKIEFDCLFTWVKNIIVYDNMLLIGMDKIVAVVDIGTKSIKAYTHISKEAEENIKMVEEQKLTSWV